MTKQEKLEKKVKSILDSMNDERNDLNLEFINLKKIIGNYHECFLYGRRFDMRTPEAMYMIVSEAEDFGMHELQTIKKKFSNRRLRVHNWSCSYALKKRRLRVLIWFFEYRLPVKED